MIRKLSLYIFVSLIALTVNAEESVANWNYNKKIVPVEGVKEYSYFFLDKEVYRVLGADLESIRIVDESDNFVPYYFDNFYQTGNKSTKKFKSKRINSEEVELTTIEYDQINYNKEEYSIEEKVYKTVFDFQVVPTEDDIKGEILDLVIDGDSYSKQVEIFGRDEKTDWSSIGTDTIYKFDGYKKNVIKLGSTQYYNFYRLVIFNNKENIDIKKLKLIYTNETTAVKSFRKSTEVKFDILTEDKKSVITIQNSDRLKFSKLVISADGQYKRDYSVKRVVEEEEYYTNVSGKLYNFQFNNIDISSNSIELNSKVFENCDEIKIVVNNKDNPPLKINEIQAEYLIDKIVFKSDKESNYKLIFGNNKVSRPAYDIEDFKQYIEKEDVSEAGLSDIVIIREEKAKKEVPFQIIFNILIVLIAVALFVVIILKMKPKKPE